MPAPVTTDLVWSTVEKNPFAVLAYVTPGGEARSAGIVYVVGDRNFFISTDDDSWKAKHIRKNPNVSLTVTIPKRLPFLPFIKIPAAVATCQGEAEVLTVDDVDTKVVERLYRGMELTDQRREDTRVIKITPAGDFVTYGVGVSLMTMRNPDDASGRAPVG
jgi:general stress protein 26